MVSHVIFLVSLHDLLAALEKSDEEAVCCLFATMSLVPTKLLQGSHNSSSLASLE